MSTHNGNFPVDSRICVISFGSEFFGRNVARLLKAELVLAPTSRVQNWPMIYMLGFYLPFANDSLNLCASLDSRCRKILHWLGTDILQLAQLHQSAQEAMRNRINSAFDFQFSESAEKQSELATLGIKTEVLPLLRDIGSLSTTALPVDFSVAVYAPSVNRKNYCLPLMFNVAECLPEIPFYFFGNRAPLNGSQNANVHVLGWREISDVIARTTLLLRYTLHDGLPTSVMEFIMSGRFAISNVDMPYVERLYCQSGVIGVRDEIIGKITDLKFRIERGETPNYAAAEYYRSLIDPNRIIRRLMQLF